LSPVRARGPKKVWIMNGRDAGANERVGGTDTGNGRAGTTAGNISHDCDGSRPPKRDGMNGGSP